MSLLGKSHLPNLGLHIIFFYVYDQRWPRPALSHTLVEIDHEIISTVILLPSADSRRAVVSNKQKYVQEVLVNCLVKLAQEKVWLGELTNPT